MVPYRKGGPIILDGRIMPLAEIDRITIKVVYAVPPRLSIMNRLYVFLFNPGKATVFEVSGLDVTEEFITDAPGSAPETTPYINQELQPATDARDVFVVHGRNLNARDALFDFLKAIDLHPVEWSEAVQATDQTMPYIGEILDAAFSKAHAVIVLFTPDDEARLRELFQSENEPDHETELTGQARPNVLFEAGMAVGRHPDRTLFVKLGNVRPFSDIAGRYIISIDNSRKQRQSLVDRLKAAGCPVNLYADNWLSEGDFDAVLSESAQATSETVPIAEDEAYTTRSLDTSKDAKFLLRNAAEGTDRNIFKITSHEGTTFRIGGLEYETAGDPRWEAAWDEALRDLVKLGLIEDQSGNATAFVVTNKGYSVIDELKSP